MLSLHEGKFTTDLLHIMSYFEVEFYFEICPHVNPERSFFKAKCVFFIQTALTTSVHKMPNLLLKA